MRRRDSMGLPSLLVCLLWLFSGPSLAAGQDDEHGQPAAVPPAAAVQPPTEPAPQAAAPRTTPAPAPPQTESPRAATTAAPRPPATTAPQAQATFTTSPSDDIDPDGKCKAAIEALCATVRPGDGRLASCLREANRAATARKQALPTSEGCRLDVRHFFIKVAKAGVDPTSEKKVMAEPVQGFRQACSADIEKHCQNEKPIMVMQCLKKFKPGLTEACREKVFMVQTFQAADLSLDVAAAEACKPDIERLQMCNITSPPGAQNVCLRKHRKELSEACRAELFRREQESSSDLRLNLDVLNACQEEVASHCKGEAFGEARVFGCLWKASLGRTTLAFSQDCRRKVTGLAKRAGSDYRLDYGVRVNCEADIEKLCSAEKQAADQMTIVELFGGQDVSGRYMEGKAGGVLKCLKKQYTDLENPGCKKAMARVVQTHATEWDAVPDTARTCKEDVDALCKDIPKTKVLRCLRKNSDKLSPECKESMHIQGQVEAMDVTFKPLIFNACQNAIRTFCRDIPSGEAKVIQCLQDNLENPEFPRKCKIEVEDDLEASNHDWRLKFGVHDQCKQDVEALCADVELTGGKAPVLECLKTNIENLKSAGCKTEVRRFVRSGVDDIRMAPVVNSMCMSDVATFCSDIQPGGGRVHDCLLRHRGDISSQCAEAEFALQALKASDVRFSSVVMQSCGRTMKTLCKDAGEGGGHSWACLEDNLDRREMDSKCRLVVQKEMALKHSEFHLNLRLANSCADDAGKVCPEELDKANFKDFSAEGQVITCLTEKIVQVNSTVCRDHLRRKVGQRVQHNDLDPKAKKACASDVARLCSGKKGMHGRVQECLHENLEQLSPPCKALQKLYMVAASSDIRMNPELEKACRHVVDKLCKDVKPGQVIRCLLDRMHKPAVDDECRQHLLVEQRKRASSFDFNPRMKANCGEDLANLVKLGACNRNEGNWQLECLTNASHVSAIKNEKCKMAISSAQLRESSDLRAKPGAEKNCEQDIKDLCPGVEPGAGRVQLCLRQHITEIKNPACRKNVEDIQLRDKTHALTNYMVQKQCVNEITAYCKDVEPGDSRLLMCLGNYHKEAGFSVGCKAALATTQMQELMKSPMASKFKADFQSLMEKHRGFLDKWGGLLFVGTLGFVSVVAFALAWCLIQRRMFHVGYSVVVPKDLEG